MFLISLFVVVRIWPRWFPSLCVINTLWVADVLSTLLFFWFMERPSWP
jgi:hypothetical protein